jgi:hypothetical protein
MATVTTYLRAARETTNRHAAVTHVLHRFTAPSSGIANGDVINLLKLPAGKRVLHAYLNVGGTLGAGATIQLRVGTTAITAASTATAAGHLVMNAKAPVVSASESDINLLVGGADISAAAAIEVMVMWGSDPS